MYSSVALANSFIELFKTGKLENLNAMKLQRIMFITQMASLQFHGEMLIDDSFVAWPHGPVVPGLYHKIKHYGPNLIKDYVLMNQVGEIVKPTIPKDDVKTWHLLESIVFQYNTQKGTDLSQLITQTNVWKSMVDKNEVFNTEKLSQLFKESYDSSQPFFAKKMLRLV